MVKAKVEVAKKSETTEKKQQSKKTLTQQLWAVMKHLFSGWQFYVSISIGIVVSGLVFLLWNLSRIYTDWYFFCNGGALFLMIGAIVAISLIADDFSLACLCLIVTYPLAALIGALILTEIGGTSTFDGKFVDLLLSLPMAIYSIFFDMLCEVDGIDGICQLVEMFN